MLNSLASQMFLRNPPVYSAWQVKHTEMSSIHLKNGNSLENLHGQEQGVHYIKEIFEDIMMIKM